MDISIRHSHPYLQPGGFVLKLRGQETKYKRNSKCPCGSGKKLKNCCIAKIKELQAAMDVGLDPQTILVNDILGIPSEPIL